MRRQDIHGCSILRYSDTIHGAQVMSGLAAHLDCLAFSLLLYTRLWVSFNVQVATLGLPPSCALLTRRQRQVPACLRASHHILQVSGQGSPQIPDGSGLFQTQSVDQAFPRAF